MKFVSIWIFVSSLQSLATSWNKLTPAFCEMRSVFWIAILETGYGTSMIHSHQRKLCRLELGTHWVWLSMFPLGIDDARVLSAAQICPSVWSVIHQFRLLDILLPVSLEYLSKPYVVCSSILLPFLQYLSSLVDFLLPHFYWLFQPCSF